jgi:predicted RNA binding protein YcfA (HicA-like mRNA interferase family)
MKIPRDLTGDDLGNALKKYGYKITRQEGSHMRLTTLQNGEHHITIPRHKPLRIGTLNSILREVEEHLKMEREELLQSLFGK